MYIMECMDGSKGRERRRKIAKSEFEKRKIKEENVWKGKKIT